jgi:hypothetical protein
MIKPLTCFPEGFTPLVIVAGDRREVPPLTRGDVLAYSFSTTDVLYLPQLRIPRSHDHPDHGTVLSDKQFAVDPDDVLRKRFGKTHILVIGSPAVNLLARRINHLSTFRFSISEETGNELAEQNEFMEAFVLNAGDLFIYHQCLEGTLDVEAIVSHSVGRVPDIAGLRKRAKKIVTHFKRTKICRNLRTRPRPIRYLMHELDKPGIFDSLSGTNRGESIGAYKDYGLISVLQNPFSHGVGYSIVYVAGVHGPGTAVGLRMLGDKKWFADHPYGGVYEVDIDHFAGYYGKIQQSVGRWETREYTGKVYPISFAVQRSARAFLSSPSARTDHGQKRFDSHLRSLLKDACLKRNITLTIEDPYTLPLGGMNFWEAILEYEKSCDFVLHDVTGCARGVMVEIGFSIGTRKDYFLIWNKRKRSVRSWKDMHMPSLLPVANVEQVDLSQAARAAHIEKIVLRIREGHGRIECAKCKGLRRNTAVKSAFIYARNQQLSDFLGKCFEEKRIRRIAEEESHMELRACQICQVLNVADLAFIQLDDDDLDSFIILGMAMALKKKILLFTLDRYDKNDFPWAKDALRFRIRSLASQLADPVSEFTAF